MCAVDHSARGYAMHCIHKRRTFGSSLRMCAVNARLHMYSIIKRCRMQTNPPPPPLPNRRSRPCRTVEPSGIAGGQSATAGMMPSSDSDSEEEAPAAKPKPAAPPPAAAPQVMPKARNRSLSCCIANARRSTSSDGLHRVLASHILMQTNIQSHGGVIEHQHAALGRTQRTVS